jgi:hypothetical protein
MKPILFVGTTIVNAALIAYSIAIISEQRKKLISKKVISFLSLGVFFDIVATVCMILGTSQTAFTLHGFLGYSALLGMLIDCVLIWKFYLSNGSAVKVGYKLHIFSRVVYIWWVLAYITGALLVAARHMNH